MPIAPDLALLVQETLSHWRSHRARRRAERIVQALPRHIQKDIGWPGNRLPERRDPRWL